MTVTIENRQPEVATKLTANHKDLDGGVRELKWQWYRSVDGVDVDGIANRARCGDYDPHLGTATDDFRYFIDTAPGLDTATWQAIPGATLAVYTPGYDEDSGGTLTVTEPTDPANDPRVETWTGGDIGLVRTTARSRWNSNRCMGQC